MKNIKNIFLISSFIVFGVFFTACTKKNTSTSGTAVVEQQDHQNEYWTCPMHPQIHKDGPGKCPICGMDLVRADSLHKDQDQMQAQVPEGHASFTLTNNRIQMIGVKYGQAEKKLLFKSIKASGRVAFDPELYNAQNEFIEAVKQLERVKDTPLADVKHSTQRMVESAKLRLKILGLSDSQITKLRSADGVTTGSNLLISSPGENVWIYAEVFEMDLSRIEPGQEVKISGSFLEGKKLIGKVASVDRVINPMTRTAKVRVQVSNGKTQLRPEAYVDVSILIPLGEQIVVPFDAVLDSGKEAWVFVVKDDGHFEPRTVIIKYYADEEIAISSGLNAGDKIVTSANFLVDSESRLKGVLSGQAGSSTKDTAPVVPQKPKCPEGQEWHDQMKHCMAKVGG